MTIEVPADLAAVLAQPVTGDVVVTEWGVFNDPDFYEPRFASKELHPNLRDKIEEPMWVSEVDGAAKRYQNWVNDRRALEGTFLREGWALLRTRTITRTAWRDVKGTELEEIDDGRKPNG